jgi:hypothetical protein
LERGIFLSVVDLQAAINRFVIEHNAEPKPLYERELVKAFPQSIGGRILLFEPLQSPSFRPDPQSLKAIARRPVKNGRRADRPDASLDFQATS